MIKLVCCKMIRYVIVPEVVIIVLVINADT